MAARSREPAAVMHRNMQHALFAAGSPRGLFHAKQSWEVTSQTASKAADGQMSWTKTHMIMKVTLLRA